jgi:hypothetical protein
MKKRIFIFLIVVISILVILHVGFFFFVNTSGKNIFLGIIKDNLGLEATVDSLSFRFPFTLLIKNFKCGDLSFQRANVSLGLSTIFTGRLNLRKIYVDGLNIKVKIEEDKVSSGPLVIKEPAEEEAPEAEEAEVKKEEKAPEIAPKITKKKQFSFKIGKLLLRNSSVEIADLTHDEPIIFLLKDINLELKRFFYPKFTKFYIKLNASLLKKDIEIANFINGDGWIDYFNKNMDVKLNVNNVDYFVFSEYYPPFWQPDNLGIKEAKLSLRVNANSKNNDLVLEGVLSLDKIDFMEAAEDNSKKQILKTVIALFKGDKEKAALPVRLKTKMDAINLDFSSLASSVKDKVKLSPALIVGGALGKTKDVVTQGVKDVKEITVDNAIGTIKGVVETIKGVVKPSSEKSTEENTQPTPDAQAQNTTAVEEDSQGNASAQGQNNSQPQQ